MKKINTILKNKKRIEKPDWNEVPARHILEQNPELKNRREHEHRRTAFSKTFAMGKNKKGEDSFRVINKLGEYVHYRKNPDDTKEAWKDINLTLQKVGNTYKVNKTFYDVVIYSDKVGYSYTSKRGGKIDVELASINGQPVDYSHLTYIANRNQIFWKGLASGLEMKLVALPQKVEIFKKIDNASAPKKFGWKITQDLKSVAIFDERTLGKDNTQAPMEINTTKTGEQIVDGRKQFIFEEEWTGRVSKVIDKRKRQKDWSGVPVYPVIIDASVTENITAGIDDVQSKIHTSYFSTSSTFKTNGANIKMGFTGSSYDGGFRFRTLGIPQGATINSAVLKLKVSYAFVAPKTKIYGDNVDNAALWASANRPKSITKTTASLAWSPTNTTGVSTSLGITAIAQEIINRTGWVSGNNIRFAIFANKAAGNGTINADAYEKAGGTPASLVVDYTSGSPVVTPITLAVTSSAASTLTKVTNFLKILSGVTSAALGMVYNKTIASNIAILGIASANITKTLANTISTLGSATANISSAITHITQKIINVITSATTKLQKSIFVNVDMISSANAVTKYNTARKMVVSITANGISLVAKSMNYIIQTSASAVSILSMTKGYLIILTTISIGTVTLKKTTTKIFNTIGITLSTLKKNIAKTYSVQAIMYPKILKQMTIDMNMIIKATISFTSNVLFNKIINLISSAIVKITINNLYNKTLQVITIGISNVARIQGKTIVVISHAITTVKREQAKIFAMIAHHTIVMKKKFWFTKYTKMSDQYSKKYRVRK